VGYQPAEGAGRRQGGAAPMAAKQEQQLRSGSFSPDARSHGGPIVAGGGCCSGQNDWAKTAGRLWASQGQANPANRR
jgi:hypothetical protein